MSTGLMSCVRENSPPLEMAGNESSGAISLPGNASVSDQQKRRRFHPLRNLRRIFRRRTLTAVDTITTVQSVSSPSSPSSSQLSSTPTVIASVPAHNLNKILPFGSNNPSPADVTTMSSAAYPSSHITNLSRGGGSSSVNNHDMHIGSIDNDIGGNGNNNRGFCDRYGGVPVMMPPLSAYNIQEINSSNYGKEHNSGRTTILKESDSGNDDVDDTREMTDYQRSFSEGRLVDGDFNREALSQSHDSVFSESATASSLSIVLKAELFDVLRKRRNRPDASDEDLGLPRSPTTPQRKDQTMNNQSEVSSLSLLSMASSDLDDESSSNYASGGGGGGGGGTNANNGSSSQADKTNSSLSSKLSQDTSKTSDELDFEILSDTRLSHSAARHKMAIRPKKKGPTRHRRPIESTILPATPEVNEDVLKASSTDIGDSSNNKHKSQSLPPGMDAKIIEERSSEVANEMLSINKTKTEKFVTSSSVSSVKNINKNHSVEDDYVNCGSTTLTLEKRDEGFFRRLLHRNSKKVKKQQDESDAAFQENISTANKQYMEQYTTFENSEEYNQKIEETRKEIRKEILTEAKSSLSAMLNTFILSPDHDKDVEFDREQELLAKINKPKSGPAARQRILPKDLSKSPLPEIKNADKTLPVAEEIQSDESSQIKLRLKTVSNEQESPVKYFKFSNDAITSALENIQTSHSKPQQSVDEINSSRLIKSYTCLEDSLKSNTEHFEKKERLQPKIIGLSPFQQKISRAEISTLDNGRPIPKQRKSVEKSKSFRYYSEGADNQNENNLKKHENMPSLPDLSFSKQKIDNFSNESDFMPLSLSFEINDNNLLKRKRQEEQLPLSQGIYTKNIILTTSKPSPIGTKPVINSCCQNITEIEENIDKLVKSPFVTVLRKSTSNDGEATELKTNVNISTASVRKTDTVIVEKTATEKNVTTTSSNKDNNYKITNDTKALSTENLSKTEFKFKDRVNSMDMMERKSMEKLESTESLITKIELRNKEKKSVTSLSSNALKVRRNSSVLEKFENGNQVPEFMKIQLNRVDPVRPKSNVVLAKNVKETEEKEIVRRFSNENVEISDSKPPLPPTSPQSPTDDIPKSPERKVDEENNILRNSENTQLNLIYERKKSVTDEKLKYEKKIEELRSEWKKQYSEENERLSSSRKTGSTEEDGGVVFRKKSFAFNNQSTNNKEDTPELMKVFARRSLKLKDEEMQTFEELEKMNSLKKLSRNLDSDKENQSSSEEKLDKLPKVEITIQQQKINASSCSKIDDKCRNASLNDLLRKPNTLITASTPSKSYISPIRYSSIVGYRNQSNFNGKSQMSANQTLTATTSSSLLFHNEQNNNTIANNNTNNINNNNINNNNNNNNVLNKRGLRHTIGPSVHNTSTTTNSTITDQSESGDIGEFKGILQRRAEWEKRAKEALK